MLGLLLVLSHDIALLSHFPHLLAHTHSFVLLFFLFLFSYVSFVFLSTSGPHSQLSVTCQNRAPMPVQTTPLVTPDTAHKLTSTHYPRPQPTPASKVPFSHGLPNASCCCSPSSYITPHCLHCLSSRPRPLVDQPQPLTQPISRRPLPFGTTALIHCRPPFLRKLQHHLSPPPLVLRPRLGPALRPTCNPTTCLGLLPDFFEPDQIMP